MLKLVLSFVRTLEYSMCRKFWDVELMNWEQK